MNYELNIGARKFKCTTIPIYREAYGLVGAICINVDVNYLTDEVALSRDEYENALAGKRHFRDFTTVAA